MQEYRDVKPRAGTHRWRIYQDGLGDYCLQYQEPFRWAQVWKDMVTYGRRDVTRGAWHTLRDEDGDARRYGSLAAVEAAMWAFEEAQDEAEHRATWRLVGIKAPGEPLGLYGVWKEKP
jgi:hypothetical protein